MVGLVHSSDAQWLAPILDRLLSRQLAYTASLLPRPAPGRMAVRIHFVGQNPTRRLSKFELNPLERSLSFYLRPHGKSLVKPPPTLKTPPSAAAAAVAAGVENSRANARSTEEADDDDEAEQQLQTLLGRWRCHLVDAVAIPSTSVVHPSSAVLQVKVKADPRRSGNAVAPEAPKNQVVLRRNTEQVRDTNSEQLSSGGVATLTPCLSLPGYEQTAHHSRGTRRNRHRIAQPRACYRSLHCLGRIPRLPRPAMSAHRPGGPRSRQGAFRPSTPPRGERFIDPQARRHPPKALAVPPPRLRGQRSLHQGANQVRQVPPIRRIDSRSSAPHGRARRSGLDRRLGSPKSGPRRNVRSAV